MKNIDQLIEALGLEQQLTLEEIPKIDLYMDQVIQLFESKFDAGKRNEQDKILTKTMINNYAKGKLLFPIKNKKYSREHLILISLIYQLKGALSINDIKITLDGVNEKIISENFQLETFYNNYLKLITKNVENFKESIKKQSEVASNFKDKENLETVLLITSLAHMSNLYRRAAEKLVDEISEQDEKHL
ncbi:DUF1836 domain-containing protein [Neobacillus sp. PS3-12]|jgi:hypothetical protein|uniref:DUF1836 domain-containing protein n=1 Tax=Neobacillus sp. PS3-12 TaxID=3070677 RepID=UPI0027DEBB17|nr:DUF1836 domain-containing protein [Neobacillus sp. PS3-12]WML51030.1 DUF1836 domain-containing protein [Neobacillus sp. PS3-12]